jgi:4-hydroxy-3-polyprenylbenzoate decarboxylase
VIPIPASRTWARIGRAESTGPAGRAHGGAEASGAGGYLHWLKYRERREPMPIAIVIGCAPVVMFTGPQKLAIDMDELGVAGALAGAPIEMAKAVTIDIDVPASSEIVIEGLIDPDKLEPEAPFGESNGYVALEAFNMPMRVTAITRKRAPVFTSIISQVTPSESSVIKKVAYEPVFFNHLHDRLSIKGIRRVVMHERLTNLRPVIFLQFADGTPRSEVWRGCTAPRPAVELRQDRHRGERGHRSASMDAVLWSLAYRTNPIEDVHSCPSRRRAGARSTARQDDFRPAHRRHAQRPMPPLALPTQGFMEHARALWGELDLPPLNVQSPWHGTRSANGPTPGSCSRAARWLATGSRTARHDRSPAERSHAGDPVRPGQKGRINEARPSQLAPFV